MRARETRAVQKEALLPAVSLSQHGRRGASARPLPAPPGSHSASACSVASCGWPITTTKPWRRAIASASASLLRTASSDSSSSRKTCAHDRRHAHLLRELVADRLRVVRESRNIRPRALELAQHGLHAGFEGGEAAAHVVVDAGEAVEAVERRRRALAQLGVARATPAAHWARDRCGRWAPSAGAASARGPSRAPPSPARAGPWHRAGRQGERSRQLPGALRARPVEADIVDHDGDQRLLARSRNGTAFLRQVSALDAAAATCGPWAEASPPASAAAGPARPRCTGQVRGGLRCARISVRPSGRRPRFISSSVSRASRSPSAPRGAGRASSRRPGWRRTAAARRRQRRSNGAHAARRKSPPNRCLQPLAEAGRQLRTLSVRLPASVLPRRHLNVSVLTPWPVALILPQFRGADKTLVTMRPWASRPGYRACRSARPRAGSPAAC